MKIVAAIHDLMFSSKVHAAAQGKPIVWLPRGTPVAEFVAKEKPDLLLIDLGSASLNGVEEIRKLKAAPDTAATRVIGYLDHTREEQIDAARAAGADQVMSKGEFARRLPALLLG